MGRRIVVCYFVVRSENNVRLRRYIGLTGLCVLVGGLGWDATGSAGDATHMSAEAAPVEPSAQPAPGARAAPTQKRDAVEVSATREVFAPGLPGAAAALAAGEAAAALDALAGAARPPTGSAAWFRHGAVAGRANRLLGHPKRAVEALEPLASHDDLAENFPREILVHELAQARVDYARRGDELGLSPAGADAQRKAAAEELGEAMAARPIRIVAPMRVTRATALAEVEGEDDKAKFWAAKRALKDLDGVIADYPNYPYIGDLLIARARAMVRYRRYDAAAAEYRRIAVERAGEPEADLAWKELGELADLRRSVKRYPFSPAENLRRAKWARVLRRVETSREVLDAMVADPKTPRSYRKSAQTSRAYTAYKQRDFVTCAEDLRLAYARANTYPLRDDLLRCLERGHQYDEAIALWSKERKKKRGPARAFALFESVKLAVRGGLYEDAEALLKRYEKVSRGNPTIRRWLHAWLPYRLGRDEEAIEGFAEVERRRGSDAKRARYFRGKLLLRSRDTAQEAQGVEILRGIMDAEPLGYYGLQARQRLIEADVDVGPAPDIQPMPDDALEPTYAELGDEIARVAAAHGEAFTSLHRLAALHGAGYLEEARREFRAVADTYINGRARMSGTSFYQPRNEDIVVGLGWKAAWKLPRMLPGSAGRKLLRNAEASDELRASLRRLAIGLHEPHRLARLTPSSQYPFKARWQPRAFRPIVERHAASHQLRPTHMWALMYTESRFRRHVVSPVGARGALQIMPWTARQLAARLGELENGRFDVDTLFDIETNARLSAYYVAELMKKFHDQAPLVYAGYNGGPNSVARWVAAKTSKDMPVDMDAFIEEIPFSETYRYTKRVMEVEATYQLLYEGKLPRWNNRLHPVVKNNIDF